MDKIDELTIKAIAANTELGSFAKEISRDESDYMIIQSLINDANNTISIIRNYVE